MLTRNWTNGSLISLCFISIAFIRPQNRIALAVDKRLAFIWNGRFAQKSLPANYVQAELCGLIRDVKGDALCFTLLSSRESRMPFLYLREIKTRCLPHRFIGIPFSVAAQSSRVVNCKLLFCRETGCDSRTRAAALFLSELFYESGSTLESSSFL